MVKIKVLGLECFIMGYSGIVLFLNYVGLHSNGYLYVPYLLIGYVAPLWLSLRPGVI